MSASPERLILMLFDGALSAMGKAREGFELENVRDRNETISNNLIKAQNIFAELQRSLRMDKGTEFSERMFGLYDFYNAKLNEANFKKVRQPIDEVVQLFTEVRDAWSEMLNKQTIYHKPAMANLAAGVGGGLSLHA